MELTIVLIQLVILLSQIAAFVYGQRTNSKFCRNYVVIAAIPMVALTLIVIWI